MKLTVEDSTIWVETTPGLILSKIASPVGVLPFLKVEALTKSKCKYCHSYSEDGLEFDFGSAHDSLWKSFDSLPELVVLMPGLQFPERDSLRFSLWLDTLRLQTFVDGKNILDFSPWQERGSQRSEVVRNISPKFRDLIARIGARWSVRALIIPVHLKVEMDPDAGEEGGYRWQSLWTLWDTQTGALLALHYANLGVVTKGDLPPDRHWSKPYIESFGRSIFPR
jgi:hypothetical protein